MVDKLQWITWSIMPLVYDESLSYVELLNKVVSKLNEVIDATNDFSEDVKEAVKEWLAESGEKTIEEAVDEAVQSYMKTGDFKTVLVEALASHSDTISDAASEAAAAWLNDTTGQDVVKTETDAALANYVKSDEFAKLVESFVTDLDTIKRGQSLNVKQINKIDMYSKDIQLNSVDMSSDYSVNKLHGYLSLDDVSATLAYGNGVDLSIIDDRVVMSKPLYMGGDAGANRKQIKQVEAPTDDNDAATKQYVDNAVKSGGTTGSGYVLFVNCYEASTNVYTCDRSYSWILEQVQKGSTVKMKFNNDILEMTSEPNELNARITFSVAQAYPANTATSQEAAETAAIECVTVKIYSDDSVIVLGNIADFSRYIRADGTKAFTSSQSMGNNRLMNVASPFADTDAANKGYVDAKAYILNTVTAEDDGSYTLAYGYAAVSAMPERYVMMMTDTDEQNPVMAMYTGVAINKESSSGTTLTGLVYQCWYAISGLTANVREIVLYSDDSVETQVITAFGDRWANLDRIESAYVYSLSGSTSDLKCNKSYLELLQAVQDGKSVYVVFDNDVYRNYANTEGDDALTFQSSFVYDGKVYCNELAIDVSDGVAYTTNSYSLASEAHEIGTHIASYSTSTSGSASFASLSYKPRNVRVAFYDITSAKTITFTVVFANADSSSTQTVSSYEVSLSSDACVEIQTAVDGLNYSSLLISDGVTPRIAGNTSKRGLVYINSVSFKSSASVLYRIMADY